MSDHLLWDMTQNRPDLPAHLDELTLALSTLLNIPSEKCDYSLQSLEEIEKQIRMKFSPAEREVSYLLLPLIVYVSETARRLANGRWVMRRAKDGEVWEPWIIDRNGNEFEFFTVVNQQFCNLPDESASIVGALLGTIRSPVLDTSVVQPAKEVKKEKGTA